MFGFLGDWLNSLGAWSLPRTTKIPWMARAKYWGPFIGFGLFLICCGVLAFPAKAGRLAAKMQVRVVGNFGGALETASTSYCDVIFDSVSQIFERAFDIVDRWFDPSPPPPRAPRLAQNTSAPSESGHHSESHPHDLPPRPSGITKASGYVLIGYLVRHCFGAPGR